MKNYTVIDGNNGMKVIDDNCETLQEVQRELNITKDLTARGETLYPSVEHFMEADITAYDSESGKTAYYKGNRRVS
jgi:hypothetical protein